MRFRSSRPKAMVVLTAISDPAVKIRIGLGARRDEGRGPDDAPRHEPSKRLPALQHVLHLVRVRTRMEVGGVLQLGVRNRQVAGGQAEAPRLGLGKLLGLVGDVAGLDSGAQRPALDRLGQHNRWGAAMLGCRAVRGVDLAVVVAATTQIGQVAVREVLDEAAETRVRPEEVLAHVAAGYRVLLELAVHGLVHLVDEHALDVEASASSTSRPR